MVQARERLWLMVEAEREATGQEPLASERLELDYLIRLSRLRFE